MFRLRRYRVFLIFAAVATALLYHFRSLGDLRNASAPTVEGLKSLGQKVELSANKVKTTSVIGIDDKLHGSSLVDSGPVKTSPPSVIHPLGNVQTAASESSSTKESSRDENTVEIKTQPSQVSSLTDSAIKATATTGALKVTPYGHSPLGKLTPADKTIAAPADPIHSEEAGPERLEVVKSMTTSKIHWSAQSEHFPVPTDSLIQLPSGTPKKIPKIQYDFNLSKSNIAAEPEKLEEIRKAFTYSWAGYREKAWMQDELLPKSGKYRNPFCGWGATLVDSLDALWMLDLKDEFEEAVNAVKDIDFTTSIRSDIPLFETVIRYLGGLIGAYDISGATHRVLLDKAVELADILMGAFDTPNRMPITYYYWKPTFASQPHRAKSKVILAELGSLSLEFTRLAQITKEPRYYDAVARITNELGIWQNFTQIPGLWPMKVDASGCKKPKVGSPAFAHLSQSSPTTHKPTSPAEKAVATHAAAVKPDDSPFLQESSRESELEDVTDEKGEASEDGVKVDASSQTPSPGGVDTSVYTAKKDRSALSPQDSLLHGRDVTFKSESPSKTEPKKEVGSTQPACEPQGLASPPFIEVEEFTIGGQADSVYEYLPKEYVLLGGLEPKYQSMYEMAADSSRKHLIYRPMIPDEKRSILQAGTLKASSKDEERDLRPEGAHLTCFAGGMFALGAKIFERKEDMDIARRLTDGCIWAYEATSTGIMPETYLSIVCKDPQSCPWNETLWKEELDPYGAQREENRLKGQEQQVLSTDTGPQIMPLNEAADAAIATVAEEATHKASLAKQSSNVSNLSSKTSEERATSTDATVVTDRASLAESRTKLKNMNDSPLTESKSSTDIAAGPSTDGNEKVLKADAAGGSVKDSATVTEFKSSTDKVSLSSSANTGTITSDSTKNEPLRKQELKFSTDDNISTETGVLKEQLKKRQLGDFNKASQSTETSSADSYLIPSKTSSRADHSDIDSSDELQSKKPQPKIASVDKAPFRDSSNEVVLQKGTTDGDGKHTAEPLDEAAQNTPANLTSSEAAKDVHLAPTVNRTQLASQYAAPKIPTREEFAAARIKDERLPIGMTRVTGGKYLLRPEAIESVFIMYRVTGDEYWREKGWAMFKAIEKHTIAAYGASAISDVTSEKPKPLDAMESFWLAETLKYFYLLYSDPSVVSLDEYILNTEAHPFKRHR